MAEDARQRLELLVLLSLGIAPFYLNGLYNARLAAGHLTWFWILEVATWIVLPPVLIFISRSRGLLLTGDLGLHARLLGRERPTAVLALVVMVSLAFVRLDLWVANWAYATFPAAWSGPSFRYVDVVPPPGPQTGWWRLLVLTHFCITAGVVEELYYRAAFSRLFPPGLMAGLAYVVASSVIFAGAHWEGGLPSLVESFVVGLFAAMVFRLTQNLWPLIVGHIITDWYWFAGGG